MIMIPAVIMAIESDDDRAYMTDIYLKHHALMLKTAWTFTRVKAEVEDIVSDSCVSMIDNLQKLRTMEDHETRSYIVNIVRNTAINHWRKKQREKTAFHRIIVFFYFSSACLSTRSQRSSLTKKPSRFSASRTGDTSFI